MNTFEKYQVFLDQDDYFEAIQKLKAADIEYEIKDKTLTTSDLSPGMKSVNVELYLKKEDFDKADQLLVSNEEIEHYLFEYSDDELVEVIVKEDEWSEFDVDLAKKILEERGKYSEEHIESLKEKRIEELRKPDEKQNKWVLRGYYLAIVGGWISVFIGLHLSTYKKKLPNGEKVYAFSESDRRNGRYIYILGIIFSLIYLFLAFYEEIMIHYHASK